MSNQQKKKYWLWFLSCFGILILILSLFLNLILAGGLIFKKGTFATKKLPFEEILIEGKPEKKEKIVMIDIFGPIFKVSDSWSTLFSKRTSVEFVIEQLEQASKDRNVKAIVLNISSPGGSVTASDEIYKQVKNVKEKGKVVITYFGEVGTSGAYYLACPSNKIFANPTSILGSIGVIISSLNVEELYKKIGLKEQVIKSGKYKDLLSSTRTMTPEEQEMMQKMIDENQKRFIDIIKENRKLDLKRIDEITDGRIFTSSQAKNLGLIDDLGYLSDAVASAAQLSKIAEPKIIRYKAPFSWDLLFSQIETVFHHDLLTKNLLEILASNQPKILFLWK